MRANSQKRLAGPARCAEIGIGATSRTEVMARALLAVDLEKPVGPSRHDDGMRKLPNCSCTSLLGRTRKVYA